MDDTKPAGTPAPESNWTPEDEAVFDIWTAEALGGCLYGLERLHFWLETRPELLEPIAQFSSLFADFKTRLTSFHVGRTEKAPGVFDPHFLPVKVETLDEAFFGDGTPNGRDPLASKPELHPETSSMPSFRRVIREAIQAWARNGREV